MYKLLTLDGLNGDYYIYDNGEIFDIRRNTFKKQYLTYKGYLQVSFYINGKSRRFFVHRLVLMMFNPVDNMENFQVNHIDGNKQNNNLSNLEWCTQSENIRHAFKSGLLSRQGERNSQCQLTENQVLEIANELLMEVPLHYIADEYGISKALVSAIRNKRLWGYLTKDFDFPVSKYANNKYKNKE